jgi:hypothetical protein
VICSRSHLIETTALTAKNTMSDNPKQTKKKEASASCSKCVTVLQQILSSVQQSADATADSNNSKSNLEESPPLTILKAIASGTGGDPKRMQGLKIVNTKDGVKVQLPVTTTLPTLLRRWSALLRERNGQDDDVAITTKESTLGHVTLACSSSSESSSALLLQQQQQDQQPPLEIELLCRKCSSTGPEGGARAFLMGPCPLSIVLCQNRIHSSREEIEEILTHELVHLYDVQNLKLDLQQCETLAYSEVRAAKAAECRNTWSALQSYCVKQKAIHATHNMFPLEGRKCIQKVFSEAFDDNRPFSEQ